MRRIPPTAAAALLLLSLLACGDDRQPSRRALPAVDEAGALRAGDPLSPRVASYRIRAALDPESHRIDAAQTLTWTNPSGRAVEVLPFHLYMNAFKNESTLFMKESGGEHRGQEVSEGDWGWIEVSSIERDGEELAPRARFPAPDRTVLELPLERPVEPGETVRLDFEFQVQLPKAFARTGFRGDFHLVGQWFPKIGVLVGPSGEERWHCEPFHAASEFFADFGTYDVEITVPNTHVVAATGVLTGAVENEDQTRTLTWRAEDVHDFAWVADPYLEHISGTARTGDGPVEVRVYFRPDQRDFAERHLEAGIGAVEIFSRDYLPYPWTRMTIVDPPPEAAGSTGGMEYPTFVTTSGDSVFAPEGVYLPELVTIHEVGHNWFQGILASNEVDEAWLDEGINQYADGLVMAELYGEETSLIDWGGYEAGYYRTIRAVSSLGEIPDPITTRSYRFADFAAYSAATYGKTALALRTLEKVVGSEDFRTAMQAYARRFAFRHPTGEDFVATLERELGEDLDWFFEPAFHERGTADYRVRDIECREKREPRGVFGAGEERRTVRPEEGRDPPPYVCEVLLVNLGRVRVPVDVEIQLADGTRLKKRWEDRERWRRYEIQRTSRVTAVRIDPGHEVLLDEAPLDNARRTGEDRGASRRAAARAQFWTQSLMQGIGL